MPHTGGRGDFPNQEVTIVDFSGSLRGDEAPSEPRGGIGGSYLPILAAISVSFA